ncbi:MAG: GntR family transcriptional regulator [Desulfotignum sp.]|nr:GntR family transcriptional regulator [Desulfotignum sp.]
MTKTTQPETDHEDLTLKAINGIKNMLFSNEIASALRLNARDLSKRLNMSPTPVIQALKLLYFQGILGHVPHKGYFLETNTPQMIQDIFHLRLALESAGLETLSGRITSSGWQALDTAVAMHLDALEKNSARHVLLADMTFHTTLARISSGSAGERLMRNLFEMLYLKNRGVVLYIFPRQRFGTHHQEILDHLKKSDIKAARKALQHHLTAVRDAVLSSMESQTDPDLDLNW